MPNGTTTYLHPGAQQNGLTVPQIQLKGAFTNGQPEMPIAVNGSRPASYIGHVVSNGANYNLPVGAVGVNVGTNLTNVNLKLQPSRTVPWTTAQRNSQAVAIAQSLSPHMHAHSPTYQGSRTLEIEISCREPDWQLSSVAQVCNSSLHHPLSTVEDLYIKHRYWELVWKSDAIEDSLWLELFLPFTAVKNLYLSKVFAPGIAAAMQELVGGRMTEVLPNLENIFVQWLETSGTFQETIGEFVAARQLSDHPIAISVWE